MFSTVVLKPYYGKKNLKTELCGDCMPLILSLLPMYFKCFPWFSNNRKIIHYVAVIVIFLHNIQKLELNIYDAYHCTENLRISCMKQEKSTANLLLWYQNYSVENKNNSSYYAERAFISLIFNW